MCFGGTIMVDVVSRMLKQQYGKRIEGLLKEVIQNNADLCTSPKLEYYKDDSLINNKIVHNAEGKAYCTNDNTIWLSDTVCCLNDNQIKEIILHELIHLTFREYDENEVICETNRRWEEMS